jgi:hypothetical protein
MPGASQWYRRLLRDQELRRDRAQQRRAFEGVDEMRAKRDEQAARLSSRPHASGVEVSPQNPPNFNEGEAA